MPEQDQQSPTEPGASTPREQLVSQLAKSLLHVFERLPPSATRGKLSRDESFISAEDFESALRILDSNGWRFSVSGRTVHVLRKEASNSPTPQEEQQLQRLQQEFPNLPEEIRDICIHALGGAPPTDGRLGPAQTLERKCASVRRYALPPEDIEEILLDLCGKVPFFSTLDWEVVTKRAERGYDHVEQFSYALVSLDTITNNHGHHDHETLTFTLGSFGLRRLISELREIERHLDGSS